VFFDETGKAFFDDGASGATENITNEQNSHADSMVTRENSALVSADFGVNAVMNV
jgi:hypothetical protein